jgi:hypothetical protein
VTQKSLSFYVCEFDLVCLKALVSVLHMVFKQAGSGLVGERCATVTIRGRWREGGRKEGRKEGRGKMRESELRLGGKRRNE